MKIFLLDQEPHEGLVRLTGNEFHYLCHVRRLKEDDTLEVKDLQNIRWKCILQEIDDSSCVLQLQEKLGKQERDQRQIYLFFCLPKGKKTDLIIRQAAEAGVYRIKPLCSDHSLIKLGGQKEIRQKTERWNRVLREAMQQSGSSIRTELLEPESFTSLSDFCDKTVFFLHQEPIKEESISDIISQTSGDLGLVIGPEGGFSSKEVKMMEDWGFVPVYLGHNILRAETAAIYGVAMLQTILGEY